MIDKLPTDEILKTARKDGGDFAEIFCESQVLTTITCDDNRVENVTTSEDLGLGLRVLHDLRTAYASTNDLTTPTLLDLARSVGSAARKTTPEKPLIMLEQGEAKSRPGVKSHPGGVALAKKIDIVTRANAVARSADKRIAQANIILKDRVRHIWIAGSDGTHAHDEQVYIAFIVTVVCRDGSKIMSSYEPVAGTKGYEIFNETPPEEIAAIAAKRALLMLDASPAPSGPMPVVIAGEAGGTMIHEAVGHGLEADLACEGLSVYRDRLEQQVASKLISIYDDSTLVGNRGSFACDDEGAAAQRTCLIENGVLKSYLHNRITATRDNTATTGNGRRQSYAHPPIVRMTNTLIAAGQDDPASIISSTPNGLFVKKMGGGQVNTVNGDFVFDVQEGYMIENGKIGEPVRGATLAGNGPKVLEIIDKVGNDVGFSIGTCGKSGQEAPVTCGQPTLRIPEIIVGGTTN